MYAKKRRFAGFSLIEVLLVVFVISIVILTFYSTLSVGTATIFNASRRFNAMSIAKARMEEYRNTPYTLLGNVSGSPAGDIPQEEYIDTDSGRYHLFTSIAYFDDDYDGSGGSDANGVITDYKTIQVTVKWGAETDSQSVFMSSYFVPVGIESLVPHTGVLIINVKDSSDHPIENAKLKITDASAYHPYSKWYDNNPTIKTNAQGQFMDLAAWEDGTPRYAIEVYKTGYKTVVTYPPYPTSPFYPIDGHVSILQGQVTQKDIVMEESSDLHVISADAGGGTVDEADFHLSGGRSLGTFPGGAKKYDMDADYSTDASGEADVDDISWGEYVVSATGETDDDFLLYRLDAPKYPYSNTFVLDPGSEKDVTVLLAPKSRPSVIFTVNDSVSGLGIEGISIRLSASPEYDATVESDVFGRAYFPPDKDDPLEEGDYSLEVDGSAVGYGDDSDTVTVGGSLSQEDIILTES